MLLSMIQNFSEKWNLIILYHILKDLNMKESSSLFINIKFIFVYYIIQSKFIQKYV